MKKFLSLLIATASIAAYGGSPIIWGPTAALNLKAGGIQLQSAQFVANDGPVNYLKNPTIETGLVSPGWSLGHVILTSGIPTGTPTFGSGASGNLSLSAATSTPIEGSYSLQVASSAATTVGDFVASDAFTIQNGNLGNVVYFQFQYQATSGASNINFSGTSSNSFMPYIYNVSQGAANWIQPVGLYCQIQGTGVGTCTGSFQATTVDTQYRLVIYNANATAGAATMYYDRLFVGPTAAGSLAQFVNARYHSTSTSVGTSLTTVVYSTADYDIGGAYNNSTGVYTVPVSGKYRIIAKIASGAMTTTTSAIQMVVRKNSTVQDLTQTIGGGGSNINYNCTIVAEFQANAGDTIDVQASFGAAATPPASTTQNVLEIAMIDGSAGAGPNGQIVASRAHVGTGASTAAGVQINFDQVDFDYTGSITTGVGTWKYVCPFSGAYLVSSNFNYGAGTVNAGVYLNGTLYAGFMNANANPGAGSTLVPCTAGQTIDFRPITGAATPTSLTSETTGQANYISISMIQGFGQNQSSSGNNPAASYWVSANFAASTSIPINFDTKEFDTCNCVTTSATAWHFTAPSVGTYNLNLYAVATAVTANQVMIYKNGSIYKNLCAANTNTAIFSTCSTGLRLNANDTIDIRPTASITFTGGTLTNGLAATIFIQRTGN
jgi:hypothetical protein